MNSRATLGTGGQDELSRSVHLSASAGSGKTRALVRRYIALIMNTGIELDQAVAITFTDKAAAEMKQRVIQTLKEAVAASDMDAEVIFKKIIRGMQDLRISTIHSFCMNILKRYPLEAGLPPDFGVMDSRDRTSKIERAIETAFDKAASDADLLALLRRYSAGNLKSLLEFMFSVRGRLKRIEIDAGGHDRFLAIVAEGIGVVESKRRLEGLLTDTTWRRDLESMESILRQQGGYYDKHLGKVHLELARAAKLNDMLSLADRLYPVYFKADGGLLKRPPIPKSGYKGDRTAYEDVFPRIQEKLAIIRDLSGRIRSGLETLSLLRLFVEADREYGMIKLREGALDFDDLEIYAYSLLIKPAHMDILYRLDRKILHFLVDEFQDTSDIQWAILEKLTEEIFAGIGADKPARPTLFVVGDEKQSIYRFREANYRLIETLRSKMEAMLPSEARVTETLSMNYRSAPEIVETVNRVFERLWPGRYLPSETYRKPHHGSVKLIEIPPDIEPDADGIPAEASVLAAEIKAVVESGMTVYERSDDEWLLRRAGYGDCSVLIQSRARLKAYETAFQRAGIPYRVIGGIGFYDEEEIQAVINILSFLWNRRDHLSLAAALKSPLFGLTDQDILDLQQESKGLFDGLAANRSDIARLFSEWMSESGLAPVSRLVHRIITDTGAYVCFGRRSGAQAVFNLDKLLDTAREFDRRGYTTLHDFVEWVKDIRRTEEQEATADVTLPEHRGSVVITTVHKAKGLEFPVVFLPGMNQTTKSLTYGPSVIIDTSGGVRMAIKDKEGPLYRELWEQEKQELLREYQRLLYVAMTRARDHLIMIGGLSKEKNPVKPNTWLYFLHEASPMPLFDKRVDYPSGLSVYAWPEIRMSPVELEAPGPSPERIETARLVSAITPVLAREAGEWKRATDFIDKTAEDRLSFSVQPGTVSPLARGGFLHRCLQEKTETGGYDLRNIAGEFTEIMSLNQDRLDVFLADAESLLSSVLGSSDLSWIFERTPNAYSELPVLYKKGDSIISGVIDRLVVSERKGFVIDYKAIAAVTEEEISFWKRHYTPQIRIYCKAAKQIFGLESVVGLLLFLDSKRLERVVEV